MLKRKQEADADKENNTRKRRCDADDASVEDPEKRAALRRLFARELPPPEDSSSSDEDEDPDPLLEVTENMDPEALGFLVCAQETLRFLHRVGLSTEDPMFARLRLRFLRGITEMVLA